jgi:hypothetical protein
VEPWIASSVLAGWWMGVLINPLLLVGLMPVIVEFDPLLDLTYRPVRTRWDEGFPVPLGANAGTSQTQRSPPLSQGDRGLVRVRVSCRRGSPTKMGP